MSKGNIWMPLYIGDYLRDTSRLTTEQHGAYLLLMMDYYINGCLPDDDLVLAGIARLGETKWKKLRPAIEPFFIIKNGVWWQGRIEKEMDKAAKMRASSAENGKKGGRPRTKKIT